MIEWLFVGSLILLAYFVGARHGSMIGWMEGYLACMDNTRKLERRERQRIEKIEENLKP